MPGKIVERSGAVVGSSTTKADAQASARGWIGVDLDGTLAEYGGFRGADEIGPPIPRMVERVKKWLAEGKSVRIFTARVHPASLHAARIDRRLVTGPIEAWCRQHIGRALPICCEKDFEMIELWDDRCVQVVPNTGRRVDGRD